MTELGSKDARHQGVRVRSHTLPPDFKVQPDPRRKVVKPKDAKESSGTSDSGESQKGGAE